MEFNTRLKEARLDRDALAELVGVTVKATYNWGANPPRYVITIIEQHKEMFVYRQIRQWIGKLEDTT